MEFLSCFLCLWLLDYVYFRIKHTKADGPPVWYFFPFLGIFPFYCLPRFLFKPLFSYYLKNFPDVIITRFVFNSCVLVKNSSIQDVQFSDECLSRSGHGFESTIASLTTGRSVWFVADNNNAECPWQSTRKTNISALNVLPKEQKFRRIADVVDCFLKTIEDHEGQLWNYGDALAFAKFQETSNVNLGRTFEVNNLQSFVDAVKLVSNRLPFIIILTHLVPLRILTTLESLWSAHLRPTLIRKVYAKLTRRLIEQKLRNSDEPRDFVEAVLRLKEPEPALDFVRETVFFNMLATTHTTQHTTLASLSYISLDRRVQRKIHEELDRVVGSAPLSHHHLSSLHYLKATIHEAYRMTPPLPTILRLTSAPARIGGYTVASSMKVAMLLISETVDANNFRDPDAFIPERFMNDEGEFESSKHFNIFSRGKRKCSGIEIASVSVQVFCAKILQHFELFPEKFDIEVPRYSGSVMTDSPAIPLRFVRREGAPAIEPFTLETGLTAFVKGVLQEELSNN